MAEYVRRANVLASSAKELQQVAIRVDSSKEEFGAGRRGGTLEGLDGGGCGRDHDQERRSEDRRPVSTKHATSASLGQLETMFASLDPGGEGAGGRDVGASVKGSVVDSVERAVGATKLPSSVLLQWRESQVADAADRSIAAQDAVKRAVVATHAAHLKGKRRACRDLLLAQASAASPASAHDCSEWGTDGTTGAS